MPALTTARDTQRRPGVRISVPLAAAARVFEGGIVCINAAGWGTKGATSTTLKAVGVAESTVDNSSGANGDLAVEVLRGWHKFANSTSTDAITLADYGAQCFLVDDQTVAKTNGANTRSVAGIVRGVDTDGVWVEF